MHTRVDRNYQFLIYTLHVVLEPVKVRQMKHPAAIQLNQKKIDSVCSFYVISIQQNRKNCGYTKLFSTVIQPFYYTH